MIQTGADSPPLPKKVKLYIIQFNNPVFSEQLAHSAVQNHFKEGESALSVCVVCVISAA